MNKSVLKIKRPALFSAFTIVLLMTFAVSLIAIPTTIAHDPPWTVPTYAYIVATPNPVGVNQQVFIIMWIDWPPPTAAGTGGDRWQGYMLTITRPDGTNETRGPLTSDSTSSAFIQYVPTQVGNYTLYFEFPGQVASLFNPLTGEPGTPSPYVNDTFTGSNATTTLTVQSEQLSPVPSYPLPSNYWTRPIEGQNTAWDRIASNWLGTGSGQIQGGGGFGGGGVQLDGAAPNSPHIMWTKPLQFGGVVGGLYETAEGVTYYSGLSYEGRMANTLIMHGRVYFDTPLSHNPTLGPYTCIDLRTGETIWTNESIAPTFGQLYDYESFNQHGVIGDGFLWQIVGTTWVAGDPRTGAWLFNLTGVPSGTTVYGPNGEILRYQLGYNGTTNSGWLALWNNTAAVGLQGGLTGSAAFQWRPLSGNRTINAADAYSWNVSIPALNGLAAPSILSVVHDDIMIGTSTALPSFQAFGSPDPLTFWAISLKPENRGTLLWIRNYTAPPGNLTLAYMGAPSSGNLNVQVDAKNRVFFLTSKETMQWWGYDMDTGEELWGPVGEFRAFQYYGTVSNPPAPGYVYNGTFYVAGYGGILYAIESRTGNILWTYGNGEPGNSTISGLETPWGNYPLFIGTIADGKIYCFSSEHSPNVPPYKGELVRCIDANTGKELWTMFGWPGLGSFGQTGFPIADGYMIYLNTYDMQIYCIGRGPSAITVEAPLAGAIVGQSVTIQGKVTDVSAGAKAKVASGEFTIVPAISDADQGRWMEHVYMQKPMPADATGVPVTLYATDANGNTEQIATVISDSTGLYNFAWTPQATGSYVITAVFEGTESYWPSSATTALSVNQAPTTTQPTIAPTTTPTPTQTITPTGSPTQTIAPTTPSPVPPGTEIPTETLLIIAAAVIIILAIATAAILLRRRK